MAQSKEDYIKDKGDKGDDVSFTLVNEDAVKRLKEDGVIKVPEKKISVPKDMRWNEKQMASKILQGIQNGDSVNKISKSLESVVDNNKVSAMRNARTMTTAAENRGRFDSYKNLDAQGVVQKKVWIATPDDRVRASHLDIDGEEQEINAPFSNGCQYPADGNGPAEEVWNCRCSMKDYIVGFRRKDGTISYVEGGPDKTMHAEQIAAKKAERAVKKSTTVVNGKDISDTWKRRPDKFAFEIEDVMNAQGFDGKPRVVSPEEFERYVEEANDGKGFIAQRTYSAPDQETLDAYRDQLYNGKWYVDCSTGGSQYGQGMYCASDYNGHLTNGIKEEMKHYKTIGESRYPVEYERTKEVASLRNDSAEKAFNKEFEKSISKLTKQEQDVMYRWLGTDDDDIRRSARAYLKTIGDEGEDKLYKLFNDIRDDADKVKHDILNTDLKEWAKSQGIDFGASSYTETVTLDKSAKIIDYDDLFKRKANWMNEKRDEFKESAIKEALKNAGLENDESAFTFLKFQTQTGNVSWNDASIAHKALGDNVSTVNELVNVIRQKESDFDMFKAGNVNDIGSFAAMLGYDAINVEGHGESGSYTVILNRTKLIIKGE